MITRLCIVLNGLDKSFTKSQAYTIERSVTVACEQRPGERALSR